MNEEERWTDNLEEMDEEASESFSRSKGVPSIGGDLFGPAEAGPRYSCEMHGRFLARDVLWKRDGKAYCPVCGKPVDLAN